jgi:excisionase family DNA binding protein
MRPQGSAPRTDAAVPAARPDVRRPFAAGEQLIDARVAGRLLGVPHTWVLAQAREGRIPHHRLGHYVRFRRSDLEEWLRETRLGPDGSSPVHGSHGGRPYRR